MSGTMSGTMGSTDDCCYSARPRSIHRALAAFNPALPRLGRVRRQAKRGLIAHDGMATTTQLLEWAYPSRDRKHWHCNELRRALRQLGAEEIGRDDGPGRPIIWALIRPSTAGRQMVRAVKMLKLSCKNKYSVT
jgi:hypothetical protein